MKIIAHRGAAGLALENTIESIKTALKLPIHAIECDVRRTADGELVLIHDYHTGRIADKTLIIQQSALADLRALPLINDERLPTLEQVLKLVGDKKPLMLDLKSPDMVDELLRLLGKYPKAEVFFSGRQYDSLAQLHQARPDIPFLVQHHYDPMEVIHRAKRMGAAGIVLNLWLMNPLTYRLAQREGLEVYVYSLERPWLLKFFKRFYPEAIIITKRPDKML